MFDRLIGNDSAKEILRRMLAKGRVPRSFLFAGAEGVGKREFALEIAKAFVCLNPQNSEACGACAACVRAGNFAFPKADDREAHKEVVFSELPDIGVVLPYGKNILVDAVRAVEREANFRPFEARARFFIIDDADKMNDAAANALLKTLEEPPETAYIFLISSRPDALLPTIRSRCQILRFAPLATGEIENYLLRKKHFSPEDARLLAKISNGSVGRALLSDAEKFRETRDAMLKILEGLLVREDRAALLRAAEDMNDAKNKDRYDATLETLETLIHDVWVLRLGRGEQITNADIENQLVKFAERAGDAQRLAAWLAEIERTRDNFRVNTNRKIATDALFMQMASGF